MRYWIVIGVLLILAAVVTGIRHVAALTVELESAKISIQRQAEYIKKFDNLIVELEKKQSEREAEAKAYGKELDRLAHESVELRALLDTAIPDDVLHGLRSCGKGGAAEGSKDADISSRRSAD